MNNLHEIKNSVDFSLNICNLILKKIGGKIWIESSYVSNIASSIFYKLRGTTIDFTIGVFDKPASHGTIALSPKTSSGIVPAID